MNRFFLLLFLLFALGDGTLARPRVCVKRNPGTKSVSFYVDGKDHAGVLTVCFQLLEVSNCGTSPGFYCYEVLQDGSTFLTLRPEDESRGIGYNYSVCCFYGRIDPQVDTTVIYRMPCTTRRPVRVLRAREVLDSGLPAAERRPLGYSFLLERGDTVYAMRRGVVARIVRPDAPAGEDPSLRYTSRRTNVVVEHPDGSQARYACFQDGELLVAEGDEVWPGTPIGLAGSYDGRQYKVSVIVYGWYFAPQADPMRDNPRSRCFDPWFATASGAVVPESGMSYQPVMDDSLLQREMSKRELKRWRAMHR